MDDTSVLHTSDNVAEIETRRNEMKCRLVPCMSLDASFTRWCALLLCITMRSDREAASSVTHDERSIKWLRRKEKDTFRVYICVCVSLLCVSVFELSWIAFASLSHSHTHTLSVCLWQHEAEKEGCGKRRRGNNNKGTQMDVLPVFYHTDAHGNGDNRLFSLFHSLHYFLYFILLSLSLALSWATAIKTTSFFSRACFLLLANATCDKWPCQLLPGEWR